MPLLFNMEGDYNRINGTGWSQDANGGGWLRDAVNGVPGLAAAIIANGFSSHPYGALKKTGPTTPASRLWPPRKRRQR